MHGIKDKWIELISKANSLGIPVPMIRDPKTEMGSVSLTLTFISFNIWVLSIVGKAAGALGGIDSGACLQMFMTCAGLYFMRSVTQSKEGKISLEKKDEEKKES